MLVPVWALTFPGVLDALGLQADLQATAWIAAIRCIGFALPVLSFALCGPDWKTGSQRRWIAWSLAAAAIGLHGSIWLVIGRKDRLPTLMADARVPDQAWSCVPPLIPWLFAGPLGPAFRPSPNDFANTDRLAE